MFTFFVHKVSVFTLKQIIAELYILNREKRDRFGVMVLFNALALTLSLNKISLSENVF